MKNVRKGKDFLYVLTSRQSSEQAYEKLASKKTHIVHRPRLAELLCTYQTIRQNNPQHPFNTERTAAKPFTRPSLTRLPLTQALLAVLKWRHTKTLRELSIESGPALITAVDGQFLR